MSAIGSAESGRVPGDIRPIDDQRSRPRLVFFYSRTSGLSRRVEGYLSQVLQRRQNHATFELVRVPIEEHEGLARRFAVHEPPMLAVVEGRRVRARVDAPRGIESIEQALAPWLR